MEIVEKFRNNKKTAQISRVLNSKGQVRFLALTNDGTQLLTNKTFLRKYAARSITKQYLNS